MEDWSDGAQEDWSVGVMEWWSDGFRKNPILHYSTTPVLQSFAVTLNGSI
jgi:hypothetical protein